MTEPTLVDSHCHLDRLEGADQPGAVAQYLADARENGVGHVLCVSIDMGNVHDVLAIAREHEGVSASAGVHPNEEPDPATEPDAATLRDLALDPVVVAVGETGLDYFRSGEDEDMEWQRERFRRHIGVAREVGKPLIIHTRAAAEDTLTILREEGAQECGAVMHCFAEDRDVARRALDMGFYISLAGIVTFKNAVELKEVAKMVPEDRLLVETDAPYLAPVPNRGKPNRPAWVRHTAEHVAELRGTSLEALAATTTANFHRLFPRAEAAAAA